MFGGRTAQPLTSSEAQLLHALAGGAAGSNLLQVWRGAQQALRGLTG